MTSFARKYPKLLDDTNKNPMHTLYQYVYNQMKAERTKKSLDSEGREQLKALGTCKRALKHRENGKFPKNKKTERLYSMIDFISYLTFPFAS